VERAWRSIGPTRVVGRLATLESDGVRVGETVRAIRTRLAALSPEGALARSVREVLETFEGASHFATVDPRIPQVVRLGREVIPILADEMRATEAGSWRARAIAEALRWLVTPDDVPLLARLAEEGRWMVCFALAGLPHDEQVSVLLRVVPRGEWDWRFLSDLDGRSFHDDDVARAFVEWLRETDSRRNRRVAGVVWYLGEVRYAPAAELLGELVQRKELAEYAYDTTILALARMGDRAMVERVAERVRIPTVGSGWPDLRVRMGELLNEIRGERLIESRIEPPAGSGNFDEGAERFLAWWKANGSRVRYDSELRRWVLP
jgi:hypothetical protein